MSELKRKVIKSDKYIGGLEYIQVKDAKVLYGWDGSLVDVIKALQAVIDEHPEGVVYCKRESSWTDDSDLYELRLIIERDETDEEYNKRVEKNKQQRITRAATRFHEAIQKEKDDRLLFEELRERFE